MIKRDNNLIIVDYKISDSSSYQDAKYGITEKIRSLITLTYDLVMSKDKRVIPMLYDCIEKYPKIPQFKNYLMVYYSLKGNKKKIHELNEIINKKHPEYLFGKLSLANELIDRKEYDSVPEILGKDFELKLLYPDRQEFHIKEVESFLKTSIRYFIGVKNVIAAKSRLKILKDLIPELPIIAIYEEQITKLLIDKGQKITEEADERNVKTKAVKVVAAMNKKPEFTNDIINELYNHGFDISHDILKNILSLPKESLIEDLHKVVYDSIARYKYFRKQIMKSEKTHSFIFHALMLISELKSEGSLHVVLDVLRQSEKHLDFWFDSFLTEQVWECIYNTGSNQLDTLKNFMKEPDRYCYTRSEVSVAVSQILHHNPERRDEVIDWYRDIFNFYIKNQDDDRIIDSDFIGFMIADVIDFSGKELKPEIIELYTCGLVSYGICGFLKKAIKDLELSYKKTHKRKLSNIYENYDYFANQYSEYEDYEDDILHTEENGNIHDISERLYLENLLYKAGRNEPCPCGSGKKFKKCHGGKQFF